jgi:hypothetical protein
MAAMAAAPYFQQLHQSEAEPVDQMSKMATQLVRAVAAVVRVQYRKALVLVQQIKAMQAETTFLKLALAQLAAAVALVHWVLLPAQTKAVTLEMA